MDVIKFRGKNMLDKWVYGSYLYDSIHDRHFILTYDEAGNIRESAVNPKTVGQYTGEHDTHNIDIYGGDILKATAIESKGMNTFVVPMPNHMLVSAVYSYEIIGNDTDNPEFVPSKKEKK